jgi:hypothetical protein
MYPAGRRRHRKWLVHPEPRKYAVWILPLCARIRGRIRRRYRLRSKRAAWCVGRMAESPGRRRHHRVFVSARTAAQACAADAIARLRMGARASSAAPSSEHDHRLSPQHQYLKRDLKPARTVAPVAWITAAVPADIVKALLLRRADGGGDGGELITSRTGHTPASPEVEMHW